MNADTDLLVTRQDVALLRRTLRHLTAAQKLLCVIAAIVTAFIGVSLLRWLLEFGRGIDYSGLQFLGNQTIAFLQQYNPFFWWGIAILCLLLLLYILYGFVAAMQRSVRGKLVRQDTAERLIQQLSPGGRAVLAWAWQDRRNPITVGVLQHALSEMRSGRAGKITLARQHALLLQADAKAPASPPETVAFPAEV